MNRFHAILSPAITAGLFCLLMMLSGCQTVSTPEQVAEAFWEAMAEGNVESAQNYATQDTQHLVSKQRNLEDSTVTTGSVVIDGGKATVKTVLALQKTENDKKLTFDTVLLKENKAWKVDYQQTLNNLSILPFGDLFKSLKAIGDTINKELENQIPLIEQQIRTFSEELIKQLDEFRRQLESPPPDKKQQPFPGTI